MGGHKGEFPISAFEWSITCALDNLAGRLTTQNRTFEAGAMDVVGGTHREPSAPSATRTTADVLDGILADEIQHVRFANRWIKKLVAQDRTGADEGGDGRALSGQANALFQPQQSEVNAVGMVFEDAEANAFRPSTSRTGSSPSSRRRDSRDPQPGRVPVAAARVPSRPRRHERPRLDPAPLRREAPARDARFDVREVLAEMANRDADGTMTLEFLHRQMNGGDQGLEMCARNLADFPDAPWELRMEIARQCWDEARHVVAFRRFYEQRGGQVGQFPVLNFQYRIIMRAATSLVGRLAVQNRSFEAAGIDAIADGDRPYARRRRTT